MGGAFALFLYLERGGRPFPRLFGSHELSVPKTNKIYFQIKMQMTSDQYGSKLFWTLVMSEINQVKSCCELVRDEKKRESNRYKNVKHDGCAR